MNHLRSLYHTFKQIQERKLDKLVREGERENVGYNHIQKAFSKLRMWKCQGLNGRLMMADLEAVRGIIYLFMPPCPAKALLGVGMTSG